MTIYSTSNLPKLLNNAKDDGWRVLGAAAADADSIGRGGSESHDVEDDSNNDNSWDVGDTDSTDNPNADTPINLKKNLQQQSQYYELDEVETGYPTILVLGSEGEWMPVG